MTVEEHFGLSEEEAFGCIYATLKTIDHFLDKGIHDPRRIEMLRSYKGLFKTLDAIEDGQSHLRATLHKSD